MYFIGEPGNSKIRAINPRYHLYQPVTYSNTFTFCISRIFTLILVPLASYLLFFNDYFVSGISFMMTLFVSLTLMYQQLWDGAKNTLSDLERFKQHSDYLALFLVTAGSYYIMVIAQIRTPSRLSKLLDDSQIPPEGLLCIQAIGHLAIPYLIYFINSLSTIPDYIKHFLSSIFLIISFCTAFPNLATLSLFYAETTGKQVPLQPQHLIQGITKNPVAKTFKRLLNTEELETTNRLKQSTK